LLLLGHSLVFELLNHYAASLSRAPTEYKLPVKLGTIPLPLEDLNGI
jgi:hypothetical protein